MDTIANIYRLLAGKRFALYLFLGFAVILVPKTVVFQANTFLDLAMQAVLGLLAINLALCTVQRFKSLRKSTLFIHIGTIVTLIGGLISGLGYVATINIHEGSTVDTVFRWDIEQDIPLGFDLRIKKIQREFYPVPVQIGVLYKGEKDSLHTVKTGESFQLDQYNVLVEHLDLDMQTILLKVHDSDGQLLGSYSTSGENTLPPGYPLAFQLVAYKDPVLKNVGAVLTLSDGERILTEGLSQVNAPLKWQGLKFHITNVAADSNGLPYVGIQIVRDPGVWFAYLGFLLICLGCMLHLQQSFLKS